MATFVEKQIVASQNATQQGVLESLGKVITCIGGNSKPFLKNAELKGLVPDTKQAVLFYRKDGQAATELPYSITCSVPVTQALRKSIKAGKKEGDIVSALLDLQITVNEQGLQKISFWGAAREFLTADQLKASYKASLEDLMATV